jgi:hypothetical protein
MPKAATPVLQRFRFMNVVPWRKKDTANQAIIEMSGPLQRFK